MKYATKKKRKAKKAARPRRRPVTKKRARSRKRPARKTNPAPVRKGKLGSWYKGPKGTRVRVRKVRGKILVDVKK